STYPELEEQNVDPLVHYLEEGARQGRNPHPNFDTGFYLAQCRSNGDKPENPLLHFLRFGADQGLRTYPDGPHAADGTSAAKRAGKTSLLLTVESLGIAARPDGGLRLSINGWALAPAPIAEISAAIDGKTVGTAVHGLARPDVGRLHPDREIAGQS